jgi:hypothetical protein
MPLLLFGTIPALALLTVREIYSGFEYIFGMMAAAHTAMPFRGVHSLTSQILNGDYSMEFKLAFSVR